MNNRLLFTWSVVGVFVIFSLAALWHFLYAWIPGSVSASIFPVNESPWEHVKLFFFPAIIFYVIQYFGIGKHYENYIFSHGIMLVIMPALTLGLFYFYRLVLKIPESLIIDILITFCVIGIASIGAYLLTVSSIKFGLWRYSVIVIVLVLFTSYAILTFYPPKLHIFMDSNTMEYGIEGGGHDHDR
jgi:hypothetical protein